VSGDGEAESSILLPLTSYSCDWIEAVLFGINETGNNFEYDKNNENNE
jgi:hypothetical protein